MRRSTLRQGTMVSRTPANAATWKWRQLRSEVGSGANSPVLRHKPPMAIYHFTAKIVKRTEGRSVAAAAADHTFLKLPVAEVRKELAASGSRQAETVGLT